MSKIVVLLGMGLVTGFTVTASAQAPTNTPPATESTREAVDAKLAEAKTAIAAGDLQKAERLLTEADQANVRYPLFHFGDTPSTVRRELMRAQSTVAADPFPNSVPMPTQPTQPARMVDPAVMPVAANGPYGNYREELPGALPGMPQAGAAPNGAMPPAAAPANYPTTDPQVQPSALNLGSAATPNRYAAPAGMMDTNQGVGNTAQQMPGISDLRFAQAPGTPAPEALPSNGAQSLLQAGESALRKGDREQALQLFRQANANRNDLDPTARQLLDSHLRMLSSAPETLDVAPTATPIANAEANIEALDSQQQVLVRQLNADVGRAQGLARKAVEKDPKEAVRLLDEVEAQVNKSGLDDSTKRIFLSKINLTRSDVNLYIEQHRSELELDERNKAVLAEIDRRNELELAQQQKIAELVDEFNKLRDDQRYHEMELVAQRLREMAPNEPVVMQVWENAKFIRRHHINSDIASRKENGIVQSFLDVDAASVATTSDGNEMVFPKNWGDLAKERGGRNDRSRRRSPKELEIEASLRKPVLMRYQNEPLAAVIEDLSKATGVNMVLDLRGLNQEGVSSDTRVSLNVNSEISLKSALNLILEPLHLSYVVKDEVLKVTSEQLKNGEIYTNVYDVADLVIPIPNFVPDNNIGLQGLINSAHAAMGYGAGAFGHGPMSFVNARNEDPAKGQLPETALAQTAMPGAGGGMASPTSLPIGGGPGGLGGAANADFDSLIDLIISTVASDTWVENGGPEAEIRPFPTNLSLVISQTQDVHEQIADLLEQLRRLQDLQVTIEVRFIRLNDTFFERIGIDFDVNIENNDPDGGTLQPGQAYEGEFPSSVVGLTDGQFPTFTNDLDIPFRQNSFGLAVPTFGTPMDVSTFGFAILSDIEAYFLINASQGDRRSNVLNAPKVTLFNGQQAFVADTSQTPFVISVVPVVGEFAAAQQPVIVVLSEGTLMTIQAVVSEDRRYVRLTVVPFFSEIGDVQEFTFEGTTSTSTSSSTTDDAEGNTLEEDEAEDIIRSGTTVQLPTFQFVSVTTTVSVPDGGTVLLGGIKRLNEGRNEFGVPLLSKVPYINRLFRNVGIGRETDSLMMMVTPRIIIQEEEEAKLLGTAIP
ncbi:hypothetical protein [Aeoliella sp. SH292]|uniref:type II secretion system protein GspD n=1 Tax=Aeoliella sp. SH292 TaxID=3454464 RepID=UPI003F95C70D